MIKIEGIPLADSPFDGATKVRDLLFYEGPLLAEFKAANGDVFLAHWCDSNETHNRWLLSRVTEREVILLESGKVTLYSLLAGRNEAVRITDLPGGPTVLTLPERLPADYFPAQDFRLQHSMSQRTYPVLLDGQWDLKRLTEMPRRFADVYVMQFFKQFTTLPPFADVPWLGGYSRYHFFTRLLKKVPGPSRPDVAQVQYASPGYIRFSGNLDLMRKVVQAVHHFESRRDRVVEPLRSLEWFIRDRDLNSAAKRDGGLTDEHRDFLESHAKAIAVEVGLEWGWLLAGVSGQQLIDGATERHVNVFKTTKLIMTYARRLMYLADLERARLAEFVTI